MLDLEVLEVKVAEESFVLEKRVNIIRFVPDEEVLLLISRLFDLHDELRDAVYGPGANLRIHFHHLFILTD